MGSFFAVFVLLTGTLLVCSVPVLVVAQRRDRLDVSRRFMQAAVLTGLTAGLATFAFDSIDSGFIGVVAALAAIYVVVVVIAAVVMSRGEAA